MGLPPEEYKFTCEEYGSTPEEHGSTTEEFHCFSTGAGGGGGRLRILNAIPHLERSFTLKTIVFHEAVFGSSSNGPPGFLLWGETLHEDTKNGWVRVGDNQDPVEY